MVYSFPWYVSGIAVVIAIVAAAIGVVLFRIRAPLALTAIAAAVAVLAGGIFAPLLALDRVVLTDEKLEQRTGFWFAPTVKGFRISEVAFITIGSATDTKGREYEVWNVSTKDGALHSIDPGDLWENNGPDIIERLKAKGVDIRQ